LSEQEIADYQSKYLDLAAGRGLSAEEKESIVDEIDFEIERLHTEYIDFDYIESLLKNFVNLSSEKQRDLKHEILSKLASEPKLYSKRELIEQFIESQLIHIDDPDTVEEAFLEYVAATKETVLNEMAAEYEVDVNAMNRTIDYCLWQNKDAPSRGEVKKLLPKEKPLIELLKLQEGLSGAIKHFIDVYCVGWA
jgi:type I restriction enzyme R subunit